MSKTVIETKKELTVTDSYDVVVCGGGIAGISAALAAARQGAKVALLEREFVLGGLATAGLIAIYLPLCDGMGKQVSFGIAEELLRLSVKHGCEGHPRGYGAWIKNDGDKVKDRFCVQYNPNIFAIDAENLLLENNVDILYGTLVSSVISENGFIKYIVTESKSGRTALQVKTVVDCTGDADVVHQAGENEALYEPGNILAGWYYSNENGKNNLHAVGYSDLPTDEKDKINDNHHFGGIEQKNLSLQTVLSHKSTLKHFFEQGEFSEEHSLTSIASIPQIRMTRRIDGVYCQNIDEEHKEFSDSVGVYSNWKKRGPVYELPFSALHGNKIKNLICAGRNISVTDELWDVTRVIPVCAVSGEAAGTAAAMFSDFTDIDIEKLQKTLKHNSVKLHEKEL